MAGRRGYAGILIGALVLAGSTFFAPGAGAGDDDSDADASAPVQGVTYSGRADGLRVELTALATTADGDTQLLANVRLECGAVRGDRAIDVTKAIVVGDDGAYAIDETIEEVGGGTLEVEIRVDGTFTDDDSTTASYSYDLFDEDDDGNSDSCDDEGDLDLEGGRPDRGLQRVEVAIPVDISDDDDEDTGGPIVASETAVYAALGDTLSDGADESLLVRIDPATNEVTAQQAVPLDLNVLAASGSALWGLDADQGALVPIDPVSLTPGAPIQIVAPRQPGDADFALFPAVAVIDGELWLSATRDQELVRVDAATGAVSARFPIDARPNAITAGPADLYVETQTRQTFDTPSGRTPETNVIRRVDRTSGETLATSSAYRDGSIGGVVAGADVVVFPVLGGGGPDQLVALDPQTLDEAATAKLQYPIAAASPGVWTISTRNELLGLTADLTRTVKIPDVTTSSSDGGVGFDALWVYGNAQRSVYRISTADRS